MIIKYILLLFSIFFISYAVEAQERTKLYFLADTINISPENRILDIGDEAKMHYFGFFCKCVPGSEIDPIFSYHHHSDQSKTTTDKPSYQYISWKDLAEIIHLGKSKFDLKYELYITEALPGKRFKTNLIRFVKVNEDITH